MFTVVEERLIGANSDTVYNLLVNFENYNEWNPWNIAVSHNAGVGEYTTVTGLLGDKEMEVRHKILVMEPNKRFIWCDTGFFTHFAYGERARFIEETPEGVMYRCELKVTGVLSFVAKHLYGNKISAGMKAEADALKSAAERSLG